MHWEDEDVEMGNTEIGESDRGMQDTAYVGAAQALSKLRGSLAQLAGGQFARHAPVSKRLRSPYKDSTQIGIVCTGTFAGTEWAGTTLPQISGLTRVYKSFKPAKAIVTELLLATFSASGQADVTKAANVSDAADLVLVQAFSGADNCFPNAPNQDNGISGPTFANNSYGNGISWPTINGGIDMSIAFAIEQSVLFQIAAPIGFTLKSITVKVRFNLLGPSLR